MVLDLRRYSDFLGFDQGAIGRFQIFHQIGGIADLDGRVIARNLAVVQREISARSSDRDARFLDAIYAARVRSGLVAQPRRYPALAIALDSLLDPV